MQRAGWGLAGIGVGIGLAWLWTAGASAGGREDAPTDPLEAPRAAGSPVGASSSASGAVRTAASPPAPRSRPTPEIPEEPEPAPEIEDPDEVGRPWLTAAEAAMEGGDLAEATRLYTDIVERVPDATFAPYAAYKLAWCAWNAGDHPQALTEMERAASWAAPSEGGRVIVEEARKDLERWRSELSEAP